MAIAKVIQHREREAGLNLIIECPQCAREVEFFDASDISCECGQWFNCFGQMLTPPPWRDTDGSLYWGHFDG